MTVSCKSLYLRRSLPAKDRLVNDPDREQNENNAVNKGRQYLKPIVTVGLFGTSPDATQTKTQKASG